MNWPTMIFAVLALLAVMGSFALGMLAGARLKSGQSPLPTVGDTLASFRPTPAPEPEKDPAEEMRKIMDAEMIRPWEDAKPWKPWKPPEPESEEAHAIQNN